MTAREMIDSLSGTLLCDERILSVPERELLANLLQRTRNQKTPRELQRRKKKLKNLPLQKLKRC